jgi:hypothetical protein
MSLTTIVPSSQRNRIIKRSIVQRAKIKYFSKEGVLYQGIVLILISNDQSAQVEVETERIQYLIQRRIRLFLKIMRK